MSVTTTADESAERFKESIITAFGSVSKLLDRGMRGADAYDSWKILNTINALQKLKDEWGIDE